MNTTASLAARAVEHDHDHRHATVPSAHGLESTLAQDPIAPSGDHDGDRHAHGADHGHDHAHAHAHAHANGAAVPPPGFSMIRASLTTRLAIAGGLSVLVWAAVLWARMPIVPVSLP